MSDKIQPPSYIEALANELLAKYRKLDSIISHAPTKGAYHEKILRDMIRNTPPSTFSTGEGLMINKSGQTSTQLDILVVDNFDPRAFGYKENDFYIATDISVVCIGEVKTYCSKKEFITAYHNLMAAKILVDDKDIPARITSFIFCYDARASQDTLAKWADEAALTFPGSSKARPWHYPDYIFCLKKKTFVERRVEGSGIRYWSAISKNTKSNIVEQLIIQNLFGMKPRPKIHEETAADMLANYFKSDMYFIETGSQGTPDVSTKDAKWEIKSPIGASANNT